ncbi:class I adenylate-forming enzyme family protein [Halorarum halobium]|uniref:class I adenylate-forming enzyme family protein n=1 Tax=Halorarum halobium TaxID=3075121 RepID=UPI0028A7BC1A|nr:class I adenylate-forming enzyme family protein [Halobaculum sp. XH14]
MASRSTNFTSVLDARTAPNPDTVALVHDATGERVTYGELADRVAAAGNVLRSRGVEQGDRVCLFFPNELSYLSALFGAMRLGAVPVPINVRLSADAITSVVADAGATVAVASGEEAIGRHALEALASPDTALETLLVDDPDPTVTDAANESDVGSFARAMDGASTDLEPAAVAPEDPAMQPYTSGSTGEPKGVLLTHGGVAWNTDSLAKALMLDDRERGLAATPLYHKNAMPGLKALLDRGGSVVVMPGFEAAAVIRAIDEHGITFITGVPAMFKLLLDETEAIAEADLSSLSFAECASAPVPAELHERFADAFDATLLEAYGLTEGGPVVSVSPRWGVTKPGSTGLAIPGTETVVVDPDSLTPLEAGDVGELLVSNPGLGRYHDRPEEVERNFLRRDGATWLRTGDLARKDGDGYHYIVGRVDDMMIVGGENVYPTEVEELLLGHPAVRDVAVVAAPHSVKGEAPVAFVVADDVTAAELKEYALDRGPAYAHPRRVFFRESLPLTGTEKIDRGTLEGEVEGLIDGTL